MKSVTLSLPLRLGLPHRTRSSAFRTRKTDFGPSNRRLSRYPNRFVAKSTSLSDRRHFRRRQIRNPRTNDAYPVRDDIVRCGQWRASTKQDASILPTAPWMTLDIWDVVKLQLFTKNLRTINRLTVPVIIASVRARGVRQLLVYCQSSTKTLPIDRFQAD
jgi:hypothetical protein